MSSIEFSFAITQFNGFYDASCPFFQKLYFTKYVMTHNCLSDLERETNYLQCCLQSNTFSLRMSAFVNYIPTDTVRVRDEEVRAKQRSVTQTFLQLFFSKNDLDDEL